MQVRFAEGVVDAENPLHDRFKWDHIDARLVWNVEPPVVRAYGALYIESSAGTDCWQRTLKLPSKDNAHFLHIPQVFASVSQTLLTRMQPPPLLHVHASPLRVHATFRRVQLASYFGLYLLRATPVCGQMRWVCVLPVVVRNLGPGFRQSRRASRISARLRAVFLGVLSALAPATPVLHRALVRSGCNFFSLMDVKNV